MKFRPAFLAACTGALLFAGLAFAGSNPAATAGTQRYGAPITVRKSTQFAKVAKQPAKFEGKVIRLEGVVANVCQGAGCWIEIESKGAKFLAKSLDESVLVPNDCKGQTVVVQGVLTAKSGTGHEGHDHAAHAGAEAHECPTPTYLLSTQGVELKPAKK